MLHKDRTWTVPGEIFPRPLFFGERVLLQARDRKTRDLFKGMQALHVLDRREEERFWSRVMPAAHDMRVFPTKRSLVMLVDGGIEALSWSDGAMLWDFRPPVDASFFTPAVTDDVVVAGRSDNVLSMLDAQIGHELWAFESPFHVGAPAVSLPWIVMGSARFLYAVRQGENELAWRYDPDGSILSNRVEDGRVWLVMRPRRRGRLEEGLRRPLLVSSLDLATGEVCWEAEAVPIEGGRLHVMGSLVILVGQGEIVAFHRETGTLAWRRDDLPVVSESEVLLLEDERMLVGPVCLAMEHGDILWQALLVGLFEPQQQGEDLLFVRSDRVLRVNRRTGESHGLYRLPKEGSPLFHVHDEVAYWGEEGRLFAADLSADSFDAPVEGPLLTCQRCRGKGRVSLHRAGRVSAAHDCELCGSSGLDRCNLPVLVGEGEA